MAHKRPRSTGLPSWELLKRAPLQPAGHLNAVNVNAIVCLGFRWAQTMLPAAVETLLWPTLALLWAIGLWSSTTAAILPSCSGAQWHNLPAALHRKQYSR